MNPFISETVCEDHIFQHVFTSYSDELYSFYSYKYYGTQGIEDVIQDAFITLWNNCKDIPQAKAKAFLYKVVNNAILNKKKHLKVVDKYNANFKSTDENITPLFVLEEKQFKEKLQIAISNLTEPQRIAFLMNRIDGKKHQAIADELGISKKAVEKRIYSALKNLRKTINEI